jgi:hypothetical protein
MNPAAADAAVTRWIQHDYADDDFGLKISAYSALKEGISKRMQEFDVCYDGDRSGIDKDRYGRELSLDEVLARNGFNVIWRPVNAAVALSSSAPVARSMPAWPAPPLSLVAARSAPLVPPSYPPAQPAPDFLPPPYPLNESFEGWDAPPAYEPAQVDAMAFGPAYGGPYRLPPLEQKVEVAQPQRAASPFNAHPLEGLIAGLGSRSGAPADKAFQLRFQSACTGVVAMISSEEDPAVRAYLQVRFDTRLNALVTTNEAYAPLVRPFLVAG